MKNDTLILFTISYPYKGYEYFIDKEMKYLSAAFDQIIIYPFAVENEKSDYYFQIPANVSVRHLTKETHTESLKTMIFKKANQIVKWYAYECLKSKHRWKYISSFTWNFYQLIDIIRTSNKLKLENLPSDAIYYAYWFDEWANALAWSRQTWLEGKVVVRMHGFDFDEQQQKRGYHSFRYSAWKYIDNVYPVSEYGVNYAKNKGLAMNKVNLARLGVEDYGLSPIPTETKLTFVSCSNFYPVKRIYRIAEILLHIKVPYRWIHIGGGEFMDENISRVRELLPEENYTFLGTMNNADVMEYLKTTPIDLFMNVSELEGLPVSLMEAISFGIPIMGCNTCGVPEIVNEQTGLLNEVNFDAKKVAEKIESYIINSGRNKDLRLNIKKYYANNFSAKRNAEKFIESIKKEKE